MIKSKDKLTVFLAPDRLTIAHARGGKIVQAESLSLDQSKWTDAWSGGLHLYDLPLRQLLARFKGAKKGWHADLFYKSPGSLCRVEITDHDESTAIAKLEGSLKQSIGTVNPVDAVSLYAVESTNVSMGVADTEANLQKVFAWMNRNKISLDQILPSDTVLVDQALIFAQQAAEETAVLFLGERSSVIAYSEHGEPKLLRLVEIGYDKLNAVYQRVFAKSEGSDESKSKDARHGAFESTNEEEVLNGMGMLFKHGVPVGKHKRPSIPELRDIMPGMAPVLQRINIEIKQTFRFANSFENAPSRLLICGPGASIPMIGSAMAEGLDLHVETDEASESYNCDELLGLGTHEHTAVTSFATPLQILPRAAKELRIQSNLWDCLKIGGGIAAALVIGQYLYADQQLADSKQTVIAQSDQISMIEQDQNRRQSIRAMASTIETAANMIDEEMGSSVDWFEFLGMMPEMDEERLQLTELQARMNAEHPMVNLTGMAIGDDEGSDASQVLSQYIKSLRALDIVNRIEIGSTSKSLLDGGQWGLSFVLSIELKSNKGEFETLTKISQADMGAMP